MWNKTPSIPWKRKLTLPQRRAAYSKSLPLPVGGAESVSCLPQTRRHLFIVNSHRWEQLVDVYCGDLRAVYQKASTGETQSTWSSGEIFYRKRRSSRWVRPASCPGGAALQLYWGFFGFVMTSEQGSVMLTFDLEEWTTGQECRVERSTETFTSPSPAFNQRCNEQDSIDNFTVYWN